MTVFAAFRTFYYFLQISAEMIRVVLNMSDRSLSLALPVPVVLPKFAEFKAADSTVRSKITGISDSAQSSTNGLASDSFYDRMHMEIDDDVRNMCAKLSEAISEFPETSEELSHLLARLSDAYHMPKGTALLAAFLGMMGVGKSTLINALFGRVLVTNSGGVLACTSIPTVIIWKKGTMDNTKLSDLAIQLFTEEQYQDCVREQINRWTEWYAHSSKSKQIVRYEDEGSLSEAHIFQEYSKSSGEFDRAQLKRGADTAKEYFEIILNVQENVISKQALEAVLHSDDIKEEEFLERCMTEIRKRCVQITELVASLKNVHDRDLRKQRAQIDKFWPLVKAVYIETGHTLLRNNIHVVDLPGYDDNNQIRNAIIDQFRAKADMEIVVTRTRVASSVSQEHWLDESIRRRGPDRTLLVTNGSDEIVTGISTVIEDLEEQPFTHLKYCLQDANRVAEFSEGNEALIHEYKECLYMNAKLAFINHQSNIVKAKFADKGVHVLLTSAREALLHQVPDPTEIPKLCMAATGIETLRGYLLMQTAASNLRTLHNHIFEALPEISVAINHIIVKFVDEDGYRTMREFLAQELCGLQKRLDALSISTLQERVKAPWNDRDIGRKILPAHKKTLDPWTTRQWPFWTFAKMLRDHGMPTGGICKDYNLNLELARTMHSYIDQWHCTMSSHPKEVTEILDAPVQAIMRELETHINLSTGDPALQRTAADAHKTLSRRIGIAYGVLLAELKKYLNENYLNFTTEKNFYSPVAGVMRPIYEATRTSTQQGKGVHSRQAFYLQQAVISPDTDQTNLREKIARSLVDSQFSFWEKSCNEYIKEVMHQFQEFQRISVELLENDAWISPQHARIRGRLEALLPQFERDLEMIQSKFFETTRRPAVKPIGSELTHNSTQSRPFLTKPCMLELALVATGKGSSRAFSTSSRPVRNLFSPVKPTSFRSSSMFTKPRRRGQGRNA
ncbi:hypothetical protein A1F96_09951 [Pyrenophora tritici-repentis]|nr:hypothetical protein A1F96_09951 [Pyrenophora tritici-repentis]